MDETPWRISHRADAKTRPIADRHYSRQKPGTLQFVPPGRCLVFRAEDDSAYWVSSWPFAEYVKHRWAGAWICSAFRNEGTNRASDLIRSAVAITRYTWGEPPPLGMVTFIDTRKVRPTICRGRPTWGYCFIKAGFEREPADTEGGLWAFRLAPDRMPEPIIARGQQCQFFAVK